MAHAEDSIIINRPVEEVFAYATDIERFPEWASMVGEAKKTSPGPVGVGTTLRTSWQFLGRHIVSDQEVTEYEPNRKMTGKSISGPMSFVITSTFEPVNDGTRFTWAIDGESKGFFAMGDSLLAQIVKRQIPAQLGIVKDLLESGVREPINP